MAIDNRYPERQYEWFVRKVVEKIDAYQDDGKGLTLTPEDKVRQAKNVTDLFMEGEGLDLTDENAVKLAAIVVVGSEED